MALLPVVLLAIGGAIQTSRTPLEFSGRVPQGTDVPMWALSLDVLLLSLPFLIAGSWGTVIVWQRTRQLFRVEAVHVGIGLFGLVPTIFVLFLLRQDIESAFSYTMIFHGNLSAGGSLAVTLIAASVWTGTTGAFLSLYLTGVVAEGSGKYDRRPDESDGVGRLLGELTSPRAG
ncbi:MAG TPA: hypothetical protein VG845_05835 [Dehalococcoidia bacterium]|nr:hypothetical protein [Dehalococcoidia bacterium]